MITKETNSSQPVTLVELEDGRFIEIRYDEDSLEIMIPPLVKGLNLRKFIAALIVYGIVDVFRKTILKFTHSHLSIEWHLTLFRFRRRISLKQVGEARCEMFDDLYLNWPEDIVTIPLSKNDCFNIYHIKTCEDQKYIANLINSFLAQRNFPQSNPDLP